MLRGFFPQGNTLDDETFRRRHLLLCWILGLHVPALFVFGLWQGVGVDHAALEVLPPAACLVLARLGRAHRRLAAFFVAAGLVYCSSVLVHLSHGSIEAHFHFFILIGLIALYQDWVPFLWNAVFTVLSHGIGGTLDPNRMYNHYAGQNRPWAWALVHGLSVLAACIGVLVFWRSTETAQRRASTLATELATAELGKVQAEAERRRAMSQLLVNLARRNQSLLNRQLHLIADLEQREVEPDALASLFQLDHVATRIRRNAESLLVLSGDEPPRRWGQPVPLPDVVRAAAAEVEDYRRVEILVDERLQVAGRAVADLAHLLAELIENATAFSPPTRPVRVRSHPGPSAVPAHVISIEDTGIGMSEADRHAANAVLTSTDDGGMLGTRLGFHVVNRLARRYGLQVHLVDTPGGGITALVSLSGDLVSVRTAQPVPVGAPGTPSGDAAVGGGEVAAAAAAATNGARTPPPADQPAAPPQPRPYVPPVPAPPPPEPAVRPETPLAPPITGDASSLVREAADLLATPAAGAPGDPSRAPGFLMTGRHPASPDVRVRPEAPAEPPTSEPPGPSTLPPEPGPREAPPAADDPGAADDPDAQVPAPGQRLTRRVPGEALAAARAELEPQPDHTTDLSSSSAGEGAGSGRESDGIERARERARVSAMLSRYQVGLRAGRAYTEANSDDRDHDGPADQERP